MPGDTLMILLPLSFAVPPSALRCTLQKPNWVTRLLDCLVPGIVRSSAFPLANAAFARPVRLPLPWMPAFAAGDGFPLKSSTFVFGRGDRVEMRRVATPPISAQMIYVPQWVDSAMHKFPRRSVCLMTEPAPRATRECSVAGWGHRGRPQPARVFATRRVNMAPKQFAKFERCRPHANMLQRNSGRRNYRVIAWRS